MTRYMVAAACASLALQFFMSTPTAQAAPPQQAGSARTSTGQVSSGTDAVKQGRTNPNHADALAALQDARATLARLTEASLSQDARDALASVRYEFPRPLPGVHRRGAHAEKNRDGGDQTARSRLGKDL